MAVAELGYAIDSSGALKAEADLDKMTAAAIRAEAQEAKLSAATDELNKISKTASSSYIALASAEDDAFAAAVRLQKAQDVLNKEVASGTISADQMANKMDVLRAKYASSINVGGEFGKTMKTSAAQTANLGAQLNDIGVMLAAGQNPLQLAVQQGTQINQVFAQMGGGKQALQGLRAGFLSMVNPMSLATIGIIAGGAAFVQWTAAALGAGDGAGSLEKQIDDLNDAISNYKKASEAASMSTSELTENYGNASDVMRSTLGLLRDIANTNAQVALDGVSKSFADMFGVAGGGEPRKAVADFFDANIFLAFTDAQREARSEARLLTSEFVNQQKALAGVLGDSEAQRDILVSMVDTVSSLADFDGVRSQAERDILKSLLEQIVAADSLAKLQDDHAKGREADLAIIAQSAIEQSEAAASIINDYAQQATLANVIALYGKDSVEHENAKREAAMGAAEEYIRQNNLSGDVAQSVRDAAASAWEAEAGAVAASNALASAERNAVALANAISAAAGFSANLQGGVTVLEAEIAALQSGADAAIARTTTAMRLQADANRQKKINAGQDKILADAQYAIDVATIERQKELLAQRNQLQSDARDSKSSGKSAAAAAKKLEKEYKSDLETLITSLQTERETIDVWYEENQAILNDRRSLELLGEEEHNQAKLRLEEEHQERLSGIRNGYNGSALDQTEAFTGAMASALQGGNDKMQAAAQAFASVEALINAYRAYNQVIADPTLPWYAKIPAAAGVLAAGLKTVQSIKSLSGSSGGTSSSGSTASAPAATTTETAQLQRAIIQVQGGRTRFTIEEINDIIAGIQKESDDGVIIEGFNLS